MWLFLLVFRHFLLHAYVFTTDFRLSTSEKKGEQWITTSIRNIHALKAFKIAHDERWFLFCFLFTSSRFILFFLIISKQFFFFNKWKSGKYLERRGWDKTINRTLLHFLCPSIFVEFCTSLFASERKYKRNIKSLCIKLTQHHLYISSICTTPTWLLIYSFIYSSIYFAVVITLFCN